MKLKGSNVSLDIINRLIENYEDYANKGELANFPYEPKDNEVNDVKKRYKLKYKVGRRVSIPGEGEGTIRLYDEDGGKYGSIKVELDNNSDKVQVIRLGIDKVNLINESTVYKWDSNRGYGYFTSSGKEEPKKEKQVIRNDFSNDEDLLFSMKRGDTIDLDYGYKITLYDSGYSISSVHPYDNTDYSFAKSTNGTTWLVIDPDTQEKTTLEVDLNNPNNDLITVINKMKEIDSTKKPRIDRS